MLFDLAFDFASVGCLAIAKVDQATGTNLAEAAALLAAAGVSSIRIDDTPAMLVLRTVAMLANEAAEAVFHGVGNAKEVDQAMRFGANYPRGPLQWAQDIGVRRVLEVLEVLQAETGDDRYRASQLLRRVARSGGTFYGDAFGEAEN